LLHVYLSAVPSGPQIHQKKRREKLVGTVAMNSPEEKKRNAGGYACHEFTKREEEKHWWVRSQ
jgi:hypothetical protein